MFKKFPRLLFVTCESGGLPHSGRTVTFKNRVKGVDLTKYAHPDALKTRQSYRYNLISTLNIGIAGSSAYCSRIVKPSISNYKKWYDIQNQEVKEVERDHDVETTANGLLFELEADEAYDQRFEQEYHSQEKIEENMTVSELELAQQDYDKKLQIYNQKYSEVDAERKEQLKDESLSGERREILQNLKPNINIEVL